MVINIISYTEMKVCYEMISQDFYKLQSWLSSQTATIRFIPFSTGKPSCTDLHEANCSFLELNSIIEYFFLQKADLLFQPASQSYKSVAVHFTGADLSISIRLIPCSSGGQNTRIIKHRIQIDLCPVLLPHWKSV